MNAAFKEVRAVKVLGRWGVIGLVCGVGLLTGCSSGEPEAADPTPAVVEPSEAAESAEPSPEPTAEESEEEHIAAAKQLVQEYFEASWALSSSGFKDLGAISRFWGTQEVAERESSMLQAAIDAGEYSEGAGEITSQTVAEYDGSSEYPQVRLDVCVDFTGLRNFDATGAEMEGADGPVSYSFLVVEHSDGTWMINEAASDTAWPC